MTAVLPHALFRGGYLLCEAGREPPAPDVQLEELLTAWSTARIGRYVLRFDDTWRIALAGAGDSEVLLLGTAMDLDRPAASGQEIVQSLAAALDASDAAFLDRVDALTGAHLIFARRGDETWALQDATGMEALCYDLGGPGPLVASHPALIAELRGYELSELGQLWVWGNPDPTAQALKMWNGRWFPGVSTPYELVRALTPNTRLDVSTHLVKRFFPREPVGTLPFEEILERVSGPLRDACAWVVSEFADTAQVSLSGGMDTRLTLAASRELRDSLTYFTYHFPDHRVHQNDMRVAAQLAERFGLRHHTFPLFAGEALERHGQEWQRTHGGLHGKGRIEFAWVEHYPTGHLHVRSNVLELVEGIFLGDPRNRRDRFDAALLSRLYAGTKGAKTFIPQLEEFIAVTDFQGSTKQDLHYADLFFWEQRLGRWHAEVVRRSKLSHTTFVIWNNRRLLTAMLARPAEDRWKARVVWRLIERLWPELLEVPVYSGSEYVERPDDRFEGKVGELRDWGRALARRARAG